RRPARRSPRGPPRAPPWSRAPDAGARAVRSPLAGEDPGPDPAGMDPAGRRLPAEPGHRADGGGRRLHDRPGDAARAGKPASARGSDRPRAAYRPRELTAEAYWLRAMGTSVLLAEEI